ncbi:ABC transporter substrate-binding protein [Natronorubrum bangense]|uniref:Family 5 extracellular solute-binding protein n=2 Tax=Natronorubrum bangense TaxID=61858 RepID=L9WL89_9EURY|nr:ABC transporter substrate-binding protein [Natronorubrum bangense]ELY50229.1 family 5 extracellular solute-binding protein [Natronorubrum bangense JCM 10635]QCC54324.1 ABC transporter substrate-binding protein [Natronorubrum bangense]
MVYDQFTATRRRVLASGAAVGTALVAGCIGGDEGPEDGLLYTQEVNPEGDFDPIISNDAYSAQVIHQVYDGLYEYDYDLELQPKIAAGDPEEERDGERYIIEIVEDAEFHNGDPVTADDVVHSFTAPIEEDTDNRPEFDFIDVDGTEPVDEHTVQIDLEHPYGAFTTLTVATYIVNESVRTDDRDAYNTNPVGCGPFTFEDWTSDEYVELERWDEYWGDPQPELESVRFEAAEDDAGRVSQILAGDTDAIATVPPEDWDQIEGEEGIEVHRTESPSYQYVAFNCNDGETADPDVRRGIAHAFSMSEFVDANLGESATPMETPIPPIVDDLGWDFSIEEEPPGYDPDEAAALLEEGLDDPDDWNPTVIVPPDDVRIALGEVIVSRLDELGYDAEVQSLDFATLTDTYISGDAEDYEMYILGWTGGPDPDVYFYNLFHEENAGVTQGHFYEGSDDFHDNILEARETADQDDRRELYTDVINEIIEEVPVMPAYSEHNTIATQEYVQGKQPHPNVSYNPELVSDENNVSLEE